MSKEISDFILERCREFGLDFKIDPQIFTYDEAVAAASYQGFPVRYPHWKWNEEYEEMVINHEEGKKEFKDRVYQIYWDGKGWRRIPSSDSLILVVSKELK